MVFFTFIVWAVCVWGCNKRAKDLNRNPIGWVIFAVLSPVLAIIWIQFMKPVGLKPGGSRLKNEDVLDD